MTWYHGVKMVDKQMATDVNGETPVPRKKKLLTVAPWHTKAEGTEALERSRELESAVVSLSVAYAQKCDELEAASAEISRLRAMLMEWNESPCDPDCKIGSKHAVGCKVQDAEAALVAEAMR